MVIKLVLESEKSSLLIESVTENWFRCYLIKPEQKIFLGANTKKHIFESLINCFTSTDVKKETWILDGLSVSNILNLSEAHHSLYCARDKNNYIIFFQDSREKTFGIIEKIEIDEITAQKWVNSLKNFRLEI